MFRIYFLLSVLFTQSCLATESNHISDLYGNPLPERGLSDFDQPNLSNMNDTDTDKSSVLKGKVFQLAANTATDGLDGVKSFVTQTFKEQITSYMQDNLNLPGWAKRIEVEFELETDAKPIYSIRTVQPLYQSADKVDTFFTQLRYARHTVFDLSRHTTNMGLGYRRLLMDKTVMLGVNFHYDREWKRNHNRLGFGLEARWSGADIFLNRYQGISSKRSVSNFVTEEIVDGWDVQALLQVPYVPSTRVTATGSRWKKAKNDYINGWRVGLESDITPFMQLSLGAADDNGEVDTEYFLDLRISLGGYGHKRPTLFGQNTISKVAWEMRDMSSYTLDRVRREENIRLKQTSAGRVVVRGF
jgi:hypothetical protein